MQYRFKQAVHIKPKGASGKDYGLGVHDVPDHHESDPYFLKLVSLGHIVDVSDEKVISAESSHERQQRLLNRIIQGRQAKVQKAAAKLTPEPSHVAKSEEALSPVSDDAPLEDKKVDTDKKKKK